MQSLDWSRQTAHQSPSNGDGHCSHCKWWNAYRPRLVKEYRHHADTPYIINPTWATRKIDVEATHLDLIRAA